ncbi:hypothetical protein FQA39_LY07088 [Lamprigera yunnana]|nr:hypothetical protein FQA39_LY07088 [Lamprigera yunnana]
MQMWFILGKKDYGILAMKLSRAENKVRDGLREDPDKRFAPRSASKGSKQNDGSASPCYFLREDANKEIAPSWWGNLNQGDLQRVGELHLVSVKLRVSIAALAKEVTNNSREQSKQSRQTPKYSNLKRLHNKTAE